MRIGDRLNPSTFGAIDDESKISTLYSTFEWPVIVYGNLGGNAETFRPMLMGLRAFFSLNIIIIGSIGG